MWTLAKNSDKNHNILQKRAPTVLNIINNSIYDQFNMYNMKTSKMSTIVMFNEFE